MVEVELVVHLVVDEPHVDELDETSEVVEELEVDVVYKDVVEAEVVVTADVVVPLV